MAKVITSRLTSITPTQLHQFLAILDEGSLGRAARHLNISEPALSKRLKDLESHLDVKLMDRTSRGMSPTPFGICLAHHARVIRGEFDRAIDNIAALKGGGKGRLSIGFSPSFGPSLVADAIAALCRKAPDIQISSYEGVVNNLMPLLLRGEIDLAVMTLDQQVSESEITKTRLGTDPTLVLARPEHPLAGRKKVRAAELLDFPWLMSRPGDRLRAWMEQRLDELGLPCPKPAVEFNSVAFARRMLADRDLLAFLPSTVMHEDLANRSFVQIPVPELRWERVIGIAHRRVVLSPLAQAMIQELKLASKSRRFT